MRGLLRVLILSFATLTPGFSAALEGGTALKPLETADANAGWEAVGRLNFAGSAFCTGALIEEDVVLTAAHCLFDKATGRRFEADGKLSEVTVRPAALSIVGEDQRRVTDDRAGDGSQARSPVRQP